MRRCCAVLLITVCALLVGLVPETAEAAAPALKFMRFYADQPGADTPYTAAKLNAEYVQVKNISKTTQVLTGYAVTDNKRYHTFRFPSGFKLAPGKTVTIHSGTGRNSATDLYWGMKKSMVWNNTGDTARLMKGSIQITACTYQPTAAQLKAKAGYKNC